MSKSGPDFDLYLPNATSAEEKSRSQTAPGLRKFTARLQPGQNVYNIDHHLGTEDVIVQTRIAGNVREGGVSIVDKNTVRLTFGGPLHEPMDVVIVG